MQNLTHAKEARVRDKQGRESAKNSRARCGICAFYRRVQMWHPSPTTPSYDRDLRRVSGARCPPAATDSAFVYRRQRDDRLIVGTVARSACSAGPWRARARSFSSRTSLALRLTDITELFSGTWAFFPPRSDETGSIRRMRRDSGVKVKINK